MDIVSEIFAGTGLQDSDGVNQLTHRSTQTQVDLSHKGGNKARAKDFTRDTIIRQRFGD